MSRWFGRRSQSGEAGSFDTLLARSPGVPVDEFAHEPGPFQDRPDLCWLDTDHHYLRHPPFTYYFWDREPADEAVPVAISVFLGEQPAGVEAP